MKKSLIFGLVLVFFAVFSLSTAFSCNSLNSTQQEVFDVTNTFYSKFKAYDAENLTDFYAKKAIIKFGVDGKKITSRSFAAKLKEEFAKYKKIGFLYEFDIESIEVLKGGVLVTSIHKITGFNVTNKYFCYIVWNNIDGKWKITRHTTYHPGIFETQFRQ